MLLATTVCKDLSPVWQVIGWILLVPFTLGILLIWLTPYMVIADALYYDKLKEITKK